MTVCVVIPANPRSGSRAGVVIPAKAGIQRKGASALCIAVVRSFVASEPACPVQFYCTGVSDVRRNVAGELRRYTTATLQEHNVVLAGYVGSVVVPHILVLAFPIQPNKPINY